MNFSNKHLPQEFPVPRKVETIVCSDLDETYIPFSSGNKKYGGVAEFEEFLVRNSEQKGILFGWITGSNLSSVLRKADNYISRSPHFISCSLGTEFYWVRNGRLVVSESWVKRIRESGYCDQNVEQLLQEIQKRKILLVKQSDDYQSEYRKSFYYYSQENMGHDFDWIERIASNLKVRAIFTKCNPGAGDPEDCYDVEFIPECCGKDETVSFLIQELALAKDNILAFGDSANDFSMFSRAGRGYFVANADRSAIETYGSSLDKPYCYGILSIVERI